MSNSNDDKTHTSHKQVNGNGKENTQQEGERKVKNIKLLTLDGWEIIGKNVAKEPITDNQMMLVIETTSRLEVPGGWILAHIILSATLCSKAGGQIATGPASLNSPNPHAWRIEGNIEILSSSSSQQFIPDPKHEWVPDNPWLNEKREETRKHMQ